mmetsp:Transcript_1848/g.4000  ORF Transcript_1848/g.4000 Transcript_1848/m.4000 type:complete len:212 (-) Transcript_1848:618-1253(-)
MGRARSWKPLVDKVVDDVHVGDELLQPREDLRVAEACPHAVVPVHSAADAPRGRPDENRVPAVLKVQRPSRIALARIFAVRTAGAQHTVGDRREPLHARVRGHKGQEHTLQARRWHAAFAQSSEAASLQISPGFQGPDERGAGDIGLVLQKILPDVLPELDYGHIVVELPVVAVGRMVAHPLDTDSLRMRAYIIKPVSVDVCLPVERHAGR